MYTVSNDLPAAYISIGLIMRDCVERSDRIKLVNHETGELVFVGNRCSFPTGYDRMKIKGFRLEAEVRARDWKERGLEAPLEPEEARDYSLKDLDIKFYKVIEF